MVERQYALVDGELLIWARESARFDLESAAKKISVPRHRLEAWENGDLRPTIKQLRKLANVYKRPIAVFYLPEPPKDFQALRDFRTLPSAELNESAPELSFEIRKVQARRDLAAELHEASIGALPGFTLAASEDEDPGTVAVRIRGFLGISLEEQASWTEQYQSLNAWRGTLENAGVLAFQFANVPLHVARGFSVFASSLPAVAANSKDAVNGRIFTFLHEVCHLALRQGGLCDLADSDGDRRVERGVEAFCNAVAGRALIPLEDLAAQSIVRRHSGPEWSDEDVQRLARRYWVSREVVLRRLLDEGLTTPAIYRQRRRQLLQEYARRSSSENIVVPQHRLALSRNGGLFTQLILDNYDRGYVTGSDVAEFLGLRLKHLRKLQIELSRRAS